jgi:hypothetical protein
MLPDPGCYEERYRLAAGAAAGLASSLITIGLVFLTVAPWVTGVVIAVALLALTGPAVAARRMIAFRADHAGITLGAVPGKLIVRRAPAAFISWADVQSIILYLAHPGGQGANAGVQCIGGPAAGGRSGPAEGQRTGSWMPGARGGGRGDPRNHRLAAGP